MSMLGQASPTTSNSVLYRAAYRNGLTFLAEVDAYAAGIGKEAMIDAHLRSTIGVNQADLAALIKEHTALSSSLLTLRSAALKERLLTAGAHSAASMNYADLQRSAIDNSRKHLAAQMSPAGFKAFDTYIRRVVMPATQVFKAEPMSQSGGLSR
jgi:hypothetical protein